MFLLGIKLGCHYLTKKSNRQITILLKESLSGELTGCWLTVNKEGKGGGGDRLFREETEKKHIAIGIVGHRTSLTEACCEVKLGRGPYAL